FNALFFQRPAVNEAPFKAMLSHMFVVLHLPAFSQFPQLLFLLCEKLCADVNYSGLICKNPFHLEWLVMEWREEAYTLDELADY
ncbi:replication initiation protein, partial [Escherichia coli]|uniref:replication initiation protein n=1 Tax=Escherichia coli TaxID=562 RepID=UPI003EE0E42B